MKLTFALPDGLRAGLVPTHRLGRPVERPGIQRLTPAKDVTVVFYVPHIQALNQVLARFGAVETSRKETRDGHGNRLSS